MQLHEPMRGVSRSMKPLHGGMNESLLSRACTFSASEIPVMRITIFIV